MNNNVLKKEFSKKDVERARNLVTGNTNARTTEGIGYSKQSEYHKEGDTWDENGKKWTIKNGLKQNITKMDRFKKIGKLPLFCPKCDTLMKKHLDKKVYPAYQKCFDCVVDEEHKLQKQGKLEDYLDNLRNKHVDTTIEEYKAFMKTTLNKSNNDFITEAGDIENWRGGTSQQDLKQQLQEGLEYLENLKIK